MVREGPDSRCRRGDGRRKEVAHPAVGAAACRGWAAAEAMAREDPDSAVVASTRWEELEAAEAAVLWAVAAGLAAGMVVKRAAAVPLAQEVGQAEEAPRVAAVESHQAVLGAGAVGQQAVAATAPAWREAVAVVGWALG